MIRREDDVLVDLVGDHVRVVLVAQTADEQQLFLGKDLAAGIRGVADDDRLGVLAERVFQAHCGRKSNVGGNKRHENRIRAGENGIRAVVFIERGEHDDLVAGVADGHHGAHHRLGAAAGDEDLGIRIDFACRMRGPACGRALRGSFPRRRSRNTDAGLHPRLRAGGR